MLRQDSFKTASTVYIINETEPLLLVIRASSLVIIASLFSSYRPSDLAKSIQQKCQGIGLGFEGH